MSQPLIMRRARADTEMAAEVEPSMETEERLAAEAEAAALRQARPRLLCSVHAFLELRVLTGPTFAMFC